MHWTAASGTDLQILFLWEASTFASVRHPSNDPDTGLIPPAALLYKMLSARVGMGNWLGLVVLRIYFKRLTFDCR
jgi:hypothetical protein